jgi:ABC-type phosphate/phosphonate transport system substrate-binding protein
MLDKIKPACLVSIMILFISIHSGTTSYGSQAAGTEPLVFNIGYTANAFAEVNINDAQAIAGRLTDFIAGKKKGKAYTKIYTSLAEVDSSFSSKDLDIIVLVGNEFVKLKSRPLLDPLFISARGGDVYEQLALIVRKDSGFKTIKDLKGRVFVNHRGLYNEMKNVWLETQVMKEGGRDIKKYFRFSKEVMKPANAILAVYFKQADCCMVTINNFNVAVELNPQLKKELMVFMESRPFAGGIVAIRKDYNRHNREIITDSMEKLHEDVQGQQLLTIFHKNRLVPYSPEYLTTLETMLKEHDELKSQGAKRRWN